MCMPTHGHLQRSAHYQKSWLVIMTVVLLVSAWPLIAGFRAANDDVKWLRTQDHDLPLMEAIRVAWSTEASFRPLEVIVGHWCDPVGLQCGTAIVVQAAGLLVLLVGLRRLCEICMPKWPAAALIAVTFIALSPATTCSVWQMDSCSQTWTAALGAWAIIYSWKVIESAINGQIAWMHLAILTGLFALGCSLKETFYGWSAGIGGACLIAMMFIAHKNWRAGLRVLPLLVPTILVPVAHLGARVALGALSQRLHGEEGSRYQVEFGMNVVINIAMSLAGIFGVGPFHLATDDHASLLLRAMPYIAVAAAMFLILAVAVLALVGRRTPTGIAFPALAFTCTAAITSISATLLMGSVSELYGFGANIGTALLLTAAVVSLWGNDAADERVIARTVAVACSAAIVPIGLYGVGSRALHFRAVWETTEVMNHALLEFQDRLPERQSNSEAPAGVACFSARCLATRTYGQYVMPAAQAINIEVTTPWLARHNPAKPITFIIGTSAGMPDERKLVFECVDMPDHGHW